MFTASGWDSTVILLIPVVVGVALGSASPALALAQVCKCTLLQLQAEAPSKAAEMALVSPQLEQLDQCVAIP